MDRNDFQEDTRVTATYKDDKGKLRPGNFYIHKLFDEFMIVRSTDSDGLLHKMNYDQVIKVIKSKAVDREHLYYVPEDMLQKHVWQDRDTLFHYASGPGRGK